MQLTEQLQHWNGEFGKQYTERNKATLKEVDELYINMYGVGRSNINQKFLDKLPRELKILEVGCNIGNQLCLLHEMGFSNLTGIDIQDIALQQAREKLPEAEFVKGSALQLPFSDDEFDFVFTSGVLIHIHPQDLPQVMAEIYRCSQQYIWGMEYYADTLTEIPYRSNQNLMWKAPYAAMFAEQFSHLNTLSKQQYPYVHDDNKDEMYLLEK